MPGLHGNISVDIRQAITNIRELKGEMKSVMATPTRAKIGVDMASARKEVRAAVREIKTELKAIGKDGAPIKLNFDSKAVKKAINDALGDIKKLQAGGSKIDLAVAVDGDNAKAELKSIRDLVDGLKRDSKIRIVVDNKDTDSSTRTTITNQRKLRDEYKKAADELRKQKQEGAAWAREIDANFRRNGTTLNRFGDEVRTVTGMLHDLPRDIRVRMRISGVEDVKKLRSEAQKGARQELGSRVGDAASTASTATGLAIFASLGAATQKTVEFDRALRNINSIAQLSEPELQKLAKSIDGISADPSIRQNVTELTTGLYDIYSVGYKGAKALDVLKDSAKGAAAGNTETAVAVDALTGVLNANIKGATDSKTVMNALFQTVNDGKVNFPQLAGAIGQTLPFLKSGGVSLQEYGAYMADATAKSQKAEFATNNLNNLILKLAAPPKQAAKAFEELGIKTGFAELKSVGFTAKMQEIIEKTKGSDDALKKLFPDMQAFTAAQTISTNGMAGYNAMAANQAKANEGIGATARAAAKQNQGAAYETDIFKKELANLAVEVGTTLVPMLTKGARTATGLLKEFRALSPETQNNTVKFIAVAGAVFLFAGRLKSAIELGILLKTALNSAAVANFLFGTSVVASTGKVGVFQVAVSLSSRALGVMRVAGVTCVGSIGGAFARLGAVGGPLALVAIIIAGFATAFFGARDAGTMSADALIKKWGLLGTLWDSLGNKLANLWTRFNGTDAANEAGDKKGYALFSAQQKKLGRKVPGFQQYVDGTHESGLTRVPKDGYIAELHKDEAVLTMPQANRWRNEQNASSGASGGTNGITRSRVLDLASSVVIPRDLVGRECAYFVTALFRKLHIAVESSNGAANLARNAAKVAPRIPLSQASAGDLIVWNNPARYGAKQENGKRSGFHVGMALGDGQVETRNRKYRGPIYDKRHAYALDTSALSPFERRKIERDAMSLPAATIKPHAVAQGALVPSYLLQRDLKRNSKGRFLSPSATPESEGMRQARDNAQEVARAIQELDRAKNLRGKENNPLALLNQKLREGAFKGVSPLNVRQLYDKTRESMANAAKTALDAAKEAAKNALEVANKPLRERLGLLTSEAGLLADNKLNQQQVSDALERQNFIREKTEELKTAGVANPADEAAKLADLNDQNKALERRNAVTTEYNQLVTATTRAVALNSARAGIYSNTQSGSDEQARALARLDEKSRLDDLVSAGKMDRGTADNSLGEWQKKSASDADVVLAQKLGERRAKIQDYIAGVQKDFQMMSVPSGLETEMAQLKSQWLADGFTDDEIAQMMPWARAQAKASEQKAFWQDIAQGVSSSFGSALQTMQQTGGSVFNKVKAGAVSMVDGIVQSFTQMATQFLQNWVLQKVLGAVMPGIGAAASAGAASGGGSWEAPSGSSAGYATGLDRVPFDGFGATVHKDEAILTAQQARQWRNAQQRATQASSASSDSSKSSTRNGGLVNVTHYNVGTVVTQDAQSFVRDTKRAGITKSRSQVRQAAGSFFDDY